MSIPRIPITAARLLHAHVADHGRLDVETGAFLLAPRGTTTVTTIPLAGSHGVVRHPYHFSVSRRAISHLFRHVTAHDLTILAQIHSHRGRAGLSETDLKHGYSVEGFTTAVVPFYRHPPFSPAEWGWWRYNDGGWEVAEPFMLANGAPTGTISFDENGIRAA
jgi:hypothetical protein